MMMWVLAPNPQILVMQPRSCGEVGGFRKRGNHVSMMPIMLMVRDLRAKALWSNSNLSRASMAGMEAINDSEELDQILVRAQDQSQPVLIDWMASWCRKCIYLKPKLEKVADEYETKAKFYYVDVNKVPQSLVKRGNISKMPTIQLWKDGEMKAEVIGGHKAWLVIEEVREMIEKFI